MPVGELPRRHRPHRRADHPLSCGYEVRERFAQLFTARAFVNVCLDILERRFEDVQSIAVLSEPLGMYDLLIVGQANCSRPAPGLVRPLPAGRPAVLPRTARASQLGD